MKLSVVLALVLMIAVVIYVLTPAESRVDRRAWLTLSKVSLKLAYADLHQGGAFTNRFANVSVHSYTNRFTIDGADYQCELAAECGRLTNRGFLAITTNQVFLWIDAKGSLTLLAKPDMRPPGF